MTDRAIASIPTRYRGVLYRSRTEARWTAPRGEERCGSGFELGRHLVAGASAAAANERFGVFLLAGAS